MFNCFINDYNPSKEYTHSEIQTIIRTRTNVLCFFAKESRQKRCAMAIDFDEYDEKDSSVPLFILTEKDVLALSFTLGKKLQKNYMKSKVGKHIIVVYTDKNCKG